MQACSGFPLAPMPSADSAVCAAAAFFFALRDGPVRSTSHVRAFLERSIVSRRRMDSRQRPSTGCISATICRESLERDPCSGCFDVLDLAGLGEPIEITELVAQRIRIRHGRKLRRELHAVLTRVTIRRPIARQLLGIEPVIELR